MTKSEDLCRRETSLETIRWLKSLKDYTPEYVHPPVPYAHVSYHRVFREDILIQRGFVVVPTFEMWDPSEDSSIAALKKRGINRIYGTGFQLHKELFFSVQATRAAIIDILAKYFDFCLLAPWSEDFLILHTHLDYWLLAGPLLLVEEMKGASIAAIFEKFEEDVAADGDDEPGKNFSAEMVAIYRLHNHRVLSPGA